VSEAEKGLICFEQRSPLRHLFNRIQSDCFILIYFKKIKDSGFTLNTLKFKPKLVVMSHNGASVSVMQFCNSLFNFLVMLMPFFWILLGMLRY